MTIKSLLRTGISLLLLSSLPAGAAFAHFTPATASIATMTSDLQEVSHNGLPHSIDPGLLSPGGKRVYQQNAPAQPSERRRSSILPAPAAGVYQQNAPQPVKLQIQHCRLVATRDCSEARHPNQCKTVLKQVCS